MGRFFRILILLLGMLPLYGDDIGPHDQDKTQDTKDQDAKDKDPKDQDPWFTGSLLSFFPENVPPGQLIVQPTFFISRRYNIYDHHSSTTHKLNSHVNTLLLLLETGITKKIDLSLELIGLYAHTDAGDAFHFGDMHVRFGFQIATDKKGTWIPDVRVLLGEGFPTGVYQNLKPELQLADVSGLGTYETSFILIVRKIFYTWPKHPYNWTINLGAIHTGKAKVHGVSIFGGTPQTKGTVGASERAFVNLDFEYKFNQQWGCGMDFNFIYQNSRSFHSESLDPFTDPPSSYIFSLAPMLEYNFSKDFGMSGGVWFSVKGRNDFAFYSGVFSIFYQF